MTVGLANVVDFLLGHPVDVVSRLIDLDRERALPTWYASIQWFCVAALLWVFATRISRSRTTSWLLLLMPAIFLMFSLDEVAQLHESVGSVLDGFVLEGARTSSPLTKTGFWIVFLGIPFVVALGLLMAALRPYLGRSRGAFAKLVSGTALFLVGAIGIEALSNLVVQGSALDDLQVITEEMFELIGSTTVLWASHELARDHGVMPRFDGLGR